MREGWQVDGAGAGLRGTGCSSPTTSHGILVRLCSCRHAASHDSPGSRSRSNAPPVVRRSRSRGVAAMAVTGWRHAARQFWGDPLDAAGCVRAGRSTAQARAAQNRVFVAGDVARNSGSPLSGGHAASEYSSRQPIKIERAASHPAFALPGCRCHGRDWFGDMGTAVRRDPRNAVGCVRLAGRRRPAARVARARLRAPVIRRRSHGSLVVDQRNLLVTPQIEVTVRRAQRSQHVAS
jgi:hypothetical protein